METNKQERNYSKKQKIKSRAYTQLGEEALQIIHRTFQLDTPVIFHLLALADGSLDSNLNSPPILYIIQEGINCLPTTDYFFTNVKPTPIIVTHSVAHQNKPTSSQAATRDPISQQTHPPQPGKTRVYPSMLTNKQVPVLNLTETSITSQADLQDAFQSLCLCSHGGKENTEDQSTE